MENLTEKNQKLWKVAQKRANFKKHLYTYLIINAFLWVWWFAGKKDGDESGMPWPIWSTIGWGIGIAFNYVGAYHGDKDEMADKEYKKLLDEEK